MKRFVILFLLLVPITYCPLNEPRVINFQDISITVQTYCIDSKVILLTKNNSRENYGQIVMTPVPGNSNTRCDCE